MTIRREEKLMVHNTPLPMGKMKVGFLWSFHHENTPIQYTAIFQGFKNDYLQMKNCDIFLIFAQNIDCAWVHVRTASVRRF